MHERVKPSQPNALCFNASITLKMCEGKNNTRVKQNVTLLTYQLAIFLWEDMHSQNISIKYYE